MATGKTWEYTIAVPSYNKGTGYVTLYFQEDYDVAGNYSVIKITGARVNHSSYKGRYYVNATIKADGVLIGQMAGNQYSGRITSVGNSVAVEGTFPVTSGNRIAHNADGSKSVTIAVTIDSLFSNDAGWVVDNVSGTQSVALTTIPRASEISATDANIGAVSSVVVNRKSSAYTHSIAYKFGDLSGYINADGSISSTEVKHDAISIGFTIPTSFYEQIPDSKTGTCTLTIKTYSGSTQIGDAKSGTFTVTAAEANSAPSVSGTVVDNNATTKALTGDANKLVRFFSTALATITATAKNSASIASKTIAGVTVSGNTHTISAVETDQFVFAATDSRGYSSSATVIKTLIPYIKLTANMSVSRDDPTSGKATLVIKGDYFNGSFGAVANTLTVQYRIDGGSWMSVTPTLDGNTYTATKALTGLNYLNTFDFEVKVTDKLMTVTKSAMLNKGIPNYHMGEEDVTFEVPVNIQSALHTAQLNIGGALDVGGYLTINGDLITSKPVAPRNLLDNSDFTNPVNQRGATSYSNNAAYAIDRWVNDSNSGCLTVVVNNGNVQLKNNPVSGNTIFLQRIAKLQQGKYTFAVKTNYGITVNNIDFTGDAIDYPNTYISNYWWLNINNQATYPSVRIVNTTANEETLTIYWAALYEGEYTAETLPHYVPKGYVAELLECQRYYYHRVGARTAGHFGDYGNKFVMRIPLPVLLRITPTATLITPDNIVVNIGTKSVIGVSSISSVSMATNGVDVTLNTASTPGGFAPGYTFGTAISLSADL